MSQSSGYSAAEWADRLLSGDREVTPFYVGSPDDVFNHAGRRLQKMPAPLDESELDQWRQWLAPFGMTKAVDGNLAALTSAKTIAVVTGQQAGFLGGPLFTLYKAAGAIRLARDIQKQTGIRCVPLFWVASDDHDFAEVAVYNWPGSRGRVFNQRFEEQPEDSGRPVFDRCLSKPDMEAFTKVFTDSTGESMFRKDTLEFIQRIVALPGLTWESQFVACLLEWFGKAGLVPLVPRLSFMRMRAARVMRSEIESLGVTSELLINEGVRLERQGVGNSVIHRSGNEANFFLSEDGVRAKVRWKGEVAELLHPVKGHVLGTLSQRELFQRLENHPEDFSPNAALRPVVQDALLPTVAYVGGPSEVVYHAQAGPLYGHFDVFRPIVIPRPSALLLTSRARRILDRWQVKPGEVLSLDQEALKATAAWKADREKARIQFAERVAAIRTEIGLLDEVIDTNVRDTGLVRASARLRRTFDKATRRLDKGLDSWLASRDQQVQGEYHDLDTLLFPGGGKQERLLGALSPLLLEAGPAAPLAFIDRLDPLSSGTTVLKLEELPGIQLK